MRNFGEPGDWWLFSFLTAVIFISFFVSFLCGYQSFESYVVEKEYFSTKEKHLFNSKNNSFESVKEGDAL